jgi:hypothetical protein
MSALDCTDHHDFHAGIADNGHLDGPNRLKFGPCVVATGRHNEGWFGTSAVRAG